MNEGFDRKNQLQVTDAYFEYREFEFKFTGDSFSAYTDGSRSRNLSGSGALILHNLSAGSRHVLQEIATPTGDQSISYAELFAFLSVLRWLVCAEIITSSDSAMDFHFITDSAYVKRILCQTQIPETHFYIIQEIKHLAASLSSHLKFYIHWIPSHIERFSQGKFRIDGNTAADALANQGREANSNSPILEADVHSIRAQILTSSAEVVWQITQLLKDTPPPSDGPSSDDFSFANANQVFSSGEPL